MTDTPLPNEDDTYSEAEADARREAALKRMLAMPPTKHKPIGARPPRKDKGKPKGDDQ